MMYGVFLLKDKKWAEHIQQVLVIPTLSCIHARTHKPPVTHAILENYVPSQLLWH